ncbi:hypothetical protein [Flavobacterium sp.]|uniref:hypothetical protein n=1 Tax=Flavobacterium sp. TaxID=239 RepID=UPI00404818C0
MRYTTILLISLMLFSCTEKEKTYEELEAEVLCDVLPEVLERELKFYSVRIPPPQILDSLKYNEKQLDSIRRQDSLSWDRYLKEFKVYYKSQLSKIREYKKVQQKVLDTLLYVKKLSTDETVYLKNELDSRKVGLDEFNDSNISVNLVPYSNTFEGQDRNSGEQVLFFTRVLMDQKAENSFFTVFKFFGTYHVFCRKIKNNKWEIRKVIPDDVNTLRE